MEGRRMTTEEILSTLEKMKEEADRYTEIVKQEIEIIDKRLEKKRKRKREKEQNRTLDQQEALEMFNEGELKKLRKPRDELSNETVNVPDDRPKKRRKITGGEASLKETVELSLHHLSNKIRKPESEVTKGTIALDPDVSERRRKLSGEDTNDTVKHISQDLPEERRKPSGEDTNDTVKHVPQDLPEERRKPSGEDTNDTVKHVPQDLPEERRNPDGKVAEETVEPDPRDAPKKRGKPRSEGRKEPTSSTNTQAKVKENGSDKRKEILTHVNPQAMKLFKSRFLKKKKPIKPSASSHVKPKTGEADKQFRQVVDQLKDHMKRRQQGNEEKRLAETFDFF